MFRFFITLMVISFTSLIPVLAQGHSESNPISTEELAGKVEGIDENVTTLLSDVDGLKKLKISGYMQIQIEKSEANKGFGMSPYDSSDYVQGRLRVRRSRIKFAYTAGLTQYVLQGDFSNTGFELKDAYLAITDPWTKFVTMTAGVFNRPVYEVEYSSSQRESMERSQVVRTLYPSERDLGLMFTIAPEDMFKLQLAAFNNTYNGDLKQFFPNHNNAPLYYMGRLTKEFAITDLGLGIDLGVHARFGNMIANTSRFIASENPTSVIDSTSMKSDDAVARNWFGAEAQIYWDILGGMKLMGEYITGSNADELTASTGKPANSYIRKRDFSGFYVMFVKNITEEWQFAAKYDSYNPNTAIEESKIDNVKDLSVSTIGIGIHNYTFRNCRISLWYDMINSTTSTNLVKGKELLAKDPVDNFLTLRMQFKF